MLLRRLKTLGCALLCAPPFLLAAVGCTFNPPVYDEFKRGPQPRTDAIFCSFEEGRRCPINDAEEAGGIDITKTDEQGFWVGSSSDYGLDFSEASRNKCGGRPEMVLYKGTYPDGLGICVNAPEILGVGNAYETVEIACRTYCEERVKINDEEFVDNDGNAYRCEHVAWAAHRAGAGAFANACGPTEQLLPTFRDVDPRRTGMHPVQWRDAVSVKVDGNSLEKLSTLPAYDAGAASVSELAVGLDGVFEFTATETDRERMAGFAEGGVPDNDPSDADITYGVRLRAGGQFDIVEHGLDVFTGSYASGDRIGLTIAGGKLQYLVNRAVIHHSGAVITTKLHISASLKDRLAGRGATITTAFVSF